MNCGGGQGKKLGGGKRERAVSKKRVLAFFFPARKRFAPRKEGTLTENEKEAGS